MPNQASHSDILDHLKTAVIQVLPDLRVRYINASAEALLAVSGQRVINEPLDELFQEHGEQDSALFEHIRAATAFTKRETQLRLSNHQIITVDCAVTPVFHQEEAIAIVVELQAMDRLLRISREEGIINSQQASQALVRGLAHEIKNPLGGLRGAAQLLAKQLDSRELTDYTNVIIEEADRLGNLVDRMLGSNSLPDMKAVNIHEILERVRSLIEAEAGESLAIERDYDPSTPEIFGDKEQLIQAVLNVARNAMQALKPTGRDDAKITLKTRTMRQFTIGTTRHRLVCCVEIADNGPGIPAEIIETLFLPMVSGRADGTGLGLSISQSIINHHQGLIECTSRPGDTRFKLYIPLRPQNRNRSHER